MMNVTKNTMKTAMYLFIEGIVAFHPQPFYRKVSI